MQAHYGVLKFFGRRRSKLTLKQSVELKYLNQSCKSYNYSALTSSNQYYFHETYKQTYYNCIRIMILFFQYLNGQSLFLISSNHFLPWSYINEFRTRHHFFIKARKCLKKEQRLRPNSSQYGVIGTPFIRPNFRQEAKTVFLISKLYW